MGQPHLIPLTNDEKDYLLTIYTTRLRLFLLSFAFMYLVLALRSSALWMNDKDFKPKGYTEYDYEIFGYLFSPWQILALTVFLLSLLLLILGTRIFMKRINPFRKDVKCGNKEMVPKIITSKSYFPMTNQYFFNFDDPDMMHYEVDAELYWGMIDGDTVLIPRAIYSKQVFEKSGRYTLM